MEIKAGRGKMGEEESRGIKRNGGQNGGGIVFIFKCVCVCVCVLVCMCVCVSVYVCVFSQRENLFHCHL